MSLASIISIAPLALSRACLALNTNCRGCLADFCAAEIYSVGVWSKINSVFLPRFRPGIFYISNTGKEH